MRAKTPALKRPDIIPAQTMSQVMALERRTTKRRNLLNGIANPSHVRKKRRWKLRTHSASAVVTARISLGIIGKKGLHLDTHIFDMW